MLWDSFLPGAVVIIEFVTGWVPLASGLPFNASVSLSLHHAFYSSTDGAHGTYYLGLYDEGRCIEFLGKYLHMAIPRK